MRRTTFTTLFHILGLTILVWGVAWGINQTLTFYAADNGLRFVQIRALIDQNWQTLAINYGGRFVDTNLNHVPYYFAYSVVDSDILLNISPYLPIVTAWLFENAGIFGLTTLPVLGGIFTAIAIYKLTTFLELPHPKLMLWATVVTTPILFYSMELWDHTLATAFVTWGIYGLVRGTKRGVFLGGVLLALGAGQRPEIYLFIIASGIAFVWVNWGQWRQIGMLVLGGIAGILPIWISQYLWVGHPLGMAFAPHLLGYGRPESFLYGGDGGYSKFFKMGRFLYYLETGDILTVGAFLSFVFGFMLFWLSVRVKKWQHPRWMLWASGLFLIQAILLGIKGTQVMIMGLITVFPLFILAVLFISKTDKIYKFIALTTLFFVAGMVLLWPAFGGGQWGSRYLLPAYPLLLLLANFHYTHHRTHLPPTLQPAFKRTASLLLVLSILLQGVGVWRLNAHHQNNADVREKMISLPHIIITDHPFLPSDMASMTDHTFLSVAGQTDLDQLVEKLQVAQIDEVAFLALNPDLKMPASFATQTAPSIYSLNP